MHHHFVQQALQPLVDMLLKLLPKQEEGQDEDDGIWNLSLAGGNCLSLVAAVVGDEVLALIMPYIQVRLLTAPVLLSLEMHTCICAFDLSAGIAHLVCLECFAFLVLVCKAQSPLAEVLRERLAVCRQTSARTQSQRTGGTERRRPQRWGPS